MGVDSITAGATDKEGDFSAPTTIHAVYKINESTIESAEKMNDFREICNGICNLALSMENCSSVKIGLDLSKGKGTMHYSANFGRPESVDAVFVNGFELVMRLISHSVLTETIC